MKSRQKPILLLNLLLLTALALVFYFKREPIREFTESIFEVKSALPISGAPQQEDSPHEEDSPSIDSYVLPKDLTALDRFAALDKDTQDSLSEFEGIPIVRPLAYQTVQSLDDRVCLLVGKIREAETHLSGMSFLNFSLINSDVVAIIYPEHGVNFEGIDIKTTYSNKDIAILGRITPSYGRIKRPQMVLVQPNQIFLLDQ